jgi:hypothetical protein
MPTTPAPTDQTEPGTATAIPATIAVPVDLFDEIEILLKDHTDRFEIPGGWPLTHEEQADFIRTFGYRLLKITQKSKAWAALRVHRSLMRMAEYEAKVRKTNLQPVTEPTKDGSTERQVP